MVYHLSLNLIHNAGATIFTDHEVLEVVEFERFCNFKNAGVFWEDRFMRKELTLSVIDYLMKKYSVEKFDMLLMNPLDKWNIDDKWKITEDSDILELMSSSRLILCDHQESHAAGGYYQSGMYSATIVTFDGGGNDGNFGIFKADKENGIVKIKNIQESVLGHRLTYFANYCKSIKKESSWPIVGALVYPGKIMGLAGYGRVREEWIAEFDEYFTGYPDPEETKYFILKKNLNLPDEFEGQLEADVAATSQHCFERAFLKQTYEYWKDSENVILVGGCAMNIINNDRVKSLKNVYVPPNPSDCGLSLHQALSVIKPKSHKEYTFFGPEVWDKHTLMEYVIQYRGQKATDRFIAKELLSGKIIGVVRGRSELGPRALGNRSIICLATFSEMKDTLNKKVKNREWYRPFAPVCRVDDAHLYFHLNGSGYNLMSFCPKVKDEYKNDLKSITHADGTARLQTVDSSSHLYEILNSISQLTNGKPPVILNTSFNIAGKPILNSYKDAVWMLENTQMDGLILEDYYISKKSL